VSWAIELLQFPLVFKNKGAVEFLDGVMVYEVFISKMRVV